ncbi:MAG: histidine kinase dimerization/phospho-acceptor domain-containing protein [Rubrivivax sp.]|nr:histidine kinase dimerization/phospho-acceptor domain-containing protein [Rubrivivax sp.]
MTALPSIRHRVSSVLVGLALLWAVVMSLVVGIVVQHEVDELLDHALQESAEVLLGLLDADDRPLPQPVRSAVPGPSHDDQLVWQLVDPQHTVLLRSNRAPETALVTQRSEGYAQVGETWRVLGVPAGRSGRMLYVAQSGDARREARVSVVAYAVGAALLVGLLGVYGLSAHVRRELLPITQLSAAVQHFDPLQTHAELAAPTRAELVPVHQAITDLGARLARHVTTERAFAAHAAHALRTPLASMAANLAAAQRRAAPGEQEQLKRTREAADRLRTVVTALLTMFRSGGEVRRERLHLDDLLAQLPFDQLALEADPAAELHADPDLLAAALLNLLDNALRHGATRVDITLVREGRGMRLRLHDNGSGLAEPRRQQLQSAMDRQHYDGQTGLGLVLADLVARAHGGRLQLLAAATGCLAELSLADAHAR